jgi:hypothetical protein
MPASPEMRATYPSPRVTASQHDNSSAVSDSRPTKAERSVSRSDSNRVSNRAMPKMMYALTGSANPLRSTRPTSRNSKRRPNSLRVDSATTIPPGSANCCNLAARLGASPTTARSAPLPGPLSRRRQQGPWQFQYEHVAAYRLAPSAARARWISRAQPAQLARRRPRVRVDSRNKQAHHRPGIGQQSHRSARHYRRKYPERRGRCPAWPLDQAGWIAWLNRPSHRIGQSSICVQPQRSRANPSELRDSDHPRSLLKFSGDGRAGYLSFPGHYRK